MSGIKHGSYQEAADDVYEDILVDLENMRDDVGGETQYGIEMAIQLIKEKRSELYGQ